MGQYDSPHRQAPTRTYHGHNITYLAHVCVPYRGLNKVTKPFEYPIPQCDNTISVFQGGSYLNWIIAVEARQGYHQVMVRVIDREKLAVSTQVIKKYCFKVMPFEPMDAQSFYSCMISNLKNNGTRSLQRH